MRFAVFSDVHANFEALEAFIAHAAERRVDRYICLGDLVGYGANPNRCIERVRELPGITVVLGNHDQAAAGGPYSMHRDAKKSLLWTQERLTEENRLFLAGLVPVISEGRMLLCHGSPSDPLGWDYVVSKGAMRRAFSKSKGRILFIGHSHVPTVLTRKSFWCMHIHPPRDRTVVPAATVTRQIFNCGSVGQPRTGDPRASYLIYDQARGMVEFHRVPYDHERAARKILKEGLPEQFAKRLSKGY